MSLLHPIRDLRRHHLLAQPIPPQWEKFVADHMACYSLLTELEQQRLLNDARVFMAEKNWEGAGGLEITDEIRITIAAQACLLQLGWDDARRANLFPNVSAVIVYPADFKVRHERVESGIFIAEPVGELGEAWSSDLPVVLSWASSIDGGERADDGHNVVLHEFAHKLDTEDGSANGVPRLSDNAEYDRWAEVMSEEYRLLTHDAERGQKTLLDSYGATNEAEFFAVATEAFFERAIRMRDEKPFLYSALRGYYQQDTAARQERKD